MHTTNGTADERLLNTTESWGKNEAKCLLRWSHLKDNNPSGFKIQPNKPLATPALESIISPKLSLFPPHHNCVPSGFKAAADTVHGTVTWHRIWHSENTWLKNVKIRNMYGIFSFIIELLLCLTRDRSADHPALWFCNDHANMWQQKALQVRGFHVPGRAGGMCGSVFLILKAVNKLVCWSWSLPGSGWGTGRYLRQRAFCSLRSFMAVLYAENLTLFRSAAGRQY